MSLIPLFYRDWWDDVERPSRLNDQTFGMGLHREDLLNSLRSSFDSPSPWRGSYLRPWSRQLARQNSGSSTLQVNSNDFQVILDVQQFSPNEITVKTQDRTVVVEGKHNEKIDEHGSISRHFVRKYLLPADIQVDQVTSTLSSDGVLTVSAPKKAPPVVGGERVVPIQPTGPARPAAAVSTTTATTPASPTPIVEEVHQIPVTQQQ